MIWGLEDLCDQGILQELGMVSLEKGISAIHTNISRGCQRMLPGSVQW